MVIMMIAVMMMVLIEMGINDIVSMANMINFANYDFDDNLFYYNSDSNLFFSPLPSLHLPPVQQVGSVEWKIDFIVFESHFFSEKCKMTK